MKEVELPGRFRQPLAPWSEEQPLQRQVLFLQTRVGTLQILGRRAGLVELTFQIVELTLQVVESLEHGTKPLLAGGQVVGDGVQVLRHDHMYVPFGAPVGEFPNIFSATLSRRVRSACVAAPRPDRFR